MESTWIGILQQLVTTLAGAAFVGLAGLAGFYVKKLTNRVKRKDLKDIIKQYVLAAEQSPSFKEFSGEQKYKAVESKAKAWGIENDMVVTEDELMILIESSVKEMKLQEPIELKRPMEKETEEKPSEEKPIILLDETKG